MAGGAHRTFAYFSFAVHVDTATGQLNQDFALIRQKIMEGERPKFEDPTAPVESVVTMPHCLLEP